MPERPELILHSGVEFTGATHIWQNLQASKEVLQLQGIKVFHPAHEGENWLEVVLDKGTTRNPWVDEGIKRIFVFDKSLACNPYAKQLSALPQIYDCKLSLFLLRQDIWLETRYLNYLSRTKQSQSALPFKDFLDNRVGLEKCLDYGNLLDTWTKLIDRKNIMVWPINHNLGFATVMQDFAQIWDLRSLTPSPATVGQSRASELTTSMLEIAQLLKTDSYPQHQRHFIHSKLEQLQPLMPQTGRVLDTAQAKEILKKYHQSNKYVARTHCDLARKQLFIETDLEDCSETETTDCEPERFLSEHIEPLLNLLVQHLLYARERAQIKSVSNEERKKEKHTKLSRELQELEDLISTPSKTAQQFWKIMMHRA